MGAVGAVWGSEMELRQQQIVVGCALAFAAGVFLCIALADLLPEVAFHAHDRLSADGGVVPRHSAGLEHRFF